MKFNNILFLFLVISFSVFSNDIRLTESNNQFVVTQKSLSEFTFVNHLSVMNTMLLQKDQKDFVRLFVDDYGKNAHNGQAELPVLEKLINIPYGADIEIDVLNIEEKIISLSDYGINNIVFPSQPSISKSQNPNDVPFYFDVSYYNSVGFHFNELVKIELLGKMRGQQLARLNISPFSYDPSNNQLRIITNCEVKISFRNIDVAKHMSNYKKYFSKDFDHLFKTCVNYIPFLNIQKDVITTYPVKYVIISDPMFQNVLQPLIEWKIKKGFIVVEEYTNNPLVGNTTTSIHAFIKDMYDNATTVDPAPTYLLIVGDEDQVPSFNGNTGSHVSDMYYCEFDGNGDFYPDMYYGRFSGVTTEDIERQVAKTLMHEKYTFPNPNFLDEIVLVAGVDAAMAPTYGNGQINYGTDYYFNPAHNLTVYNYLYGTLAPGASISSDMATASSAIISDISNGVGFANYTAHCGSSGWSDPSFSTADVPGLNNNYEFGLIIGNCCQSNKFDEPICFGEALLRAEDKGAVGYIGGSNNTYWDEDYWWAVGNTANITANPTYAGTDLGIYDCLMHENGEQQADWFITQGQIIHSGNLAVTQAGGSEEYYWEIYHLMGDPSLMPYIGVPTSLTVSHQSAIPLGATTLTVNTEEHAYVAISQNGILLDAKLADATGIVNLTFSPLSIVGAADIVVTKQFKQPYIGAVQVISPTGPYLIYTNHIVNDPTGNNNGLVDYNELIDLAVDVHNVGAANATSIDIVLSTTDPYITLINNTVTVPLINASQTVTIPSLFTFQVDPFISDQHTVVFDLEMTDNIGNAWMSTINIVVNAPVLEHTSFTINDLASGNGNYRIDAGETLDLEIDIANIGHADAFNLTASLSCFSPYITVNTSANNIASLLANGQSSIVFNITASAATPLGTYVDFILDLTDGTYSYNNNFIELIGDIAEDYETGDFTQYAWIQGSYPWIIDNFQIYEGSNSSRSAIGLPDGEESELSITVDVVAPGDISFWKFLSSEQNKDELKFKINGTKVGEWSGEDVAWSYVSYPVSVGSNTFKWEYDKSSFNSAGMDCAWIDYIVFPPLNVTQTNNIDIENINFKLFPNPTIGSFQLSFNDNKNRIIEIFNTSGDCLRRLENSSSAVEFDIKDQAPGTYIIKIYPEEIVYQIVKQ